MAFALFFLFLCPRRDPAGPLQEVGVPGKKQVSEGFFPMLDQGSVESFSPLSQGGSCFSLLLISNLSCLRAVEPLQVSSPFPWRYAE